MYYKYFNFQLNKEEDLISLKADSICVLEIAEDDEDIKQAGDNCLKDIVEKKIKSSNCKKYYIYVLKVKEYNKITDYKKIWKLGNFKDTGIFDDFYDLKDGRIYIGISEVSLFENSNFYPLTEITLLCSENAKIDFRKITDVLRDRQFSISMPEKDVIATLKDLKNVFDNVAVIYKFPHKSQICVLRDGIQNEFSDDDLPKIEIIE